MADARTTIRFDSVGAEKVKKDYADIIAADQKTGDSLKKTGGAATTAAVGVSNLGRSSRDYAAQATVASTATDRFNVGLASMARYVTAGAVLALGNQAIRSADQYRVLQGRIQEATRGTGDFAAVSETLFAVSQRTGTALETNVALFQRMAIGAREFGAANEDILKVTETVQQLGVVGGASASAIAAGTLQLAQGMAAGVLRAEELNSVIENLPEVAQSIAKGMGLTVGELRKAVLEGRVLSEDVFRSLLAMSSDAAQRFSEMPTSLAQATQKLSDAFNKAAGESKGLLETINLITGAMDYLGRNIDSIMDPVNDTIRTTVKEFTALYNVTRSILEMVGLVDAEAASTGYSYTGSRVFVKDNTIPVRGPSGAPGGGAGSRGAAPNPEKDARDRARAIKDAQEHEEAVGRAARATNGWAGALGAASSAARGVGDTIRANQSDYEAFLADIEQETRLLGLSNEAREVEIALLEARARLNVETLSPQQTAEVMGALGRNRVAKQAKEAADEVEQIWLRAKDNVSDAWSDFLFDIFDRGKISFKSFANDLKSIWARTIADMIAQSTQQSIVQPLFNALFGGTGSSGTMNVFQQMALERSAKNDVASNPEIFGTGSPVKTTVLDPLKKGVDDIFGSGAAKDFANILKGAATGAMLGGLAGSSTGGAIGGAIGMAFGPIGSLVGGLLGGLVGGLLKSTPRSIASISTTGGLAGVGATYAQGLDEKIGKSMGGGVTNALNAIAEELDATLTEDYFLGMIGQRGKKFFFQEQQSDIKKAGKSKYGAVKFESAEEAIAAAIEAAIKNGVIQGLSTAEQELLAAADDVNQALQDIVNGRNFRREVELSFIGLKNPMAADLARLSDQYAEQKKLAEKYGADMVKLEAIYQAQRKEIIEQYQEQQFSSLKALLTSLTSGSASPLSPTTRLGLAESRYNSLRAAAMRGDDAAIDQLAGAATDFLDAAKAVYATSDGYFSRYNAVIDDVSKITGVANPLTAGVQAVNDNYKAQIAQGERAIAQRAETNSLLRVIASNLGASTSATQRAAAATTANNGVAQIGGFTPEAIQKLVAGIRS